MPEIKKSKNQTTGTNEWKRMSFKGNKVWAAIGPDGDFLLKNKKILIKYNLNQDYEYLIKRDNLKPESDAIPGKKNKTKKNTGADKKLRDKKAGPDIPGSENTIIIYTDGASSGNPGPAGIGAVLIFNGQKKEISEFIGTATNNIAELTAIERALEKLKRKDLPVRLFTDSTYCAGVLSKGWKPKKNLDLINRIKHLICEFKDFKIIKVKGHAGIELNERADVLATSAIKKQE